MGVSDGVAPVTLQLIGDYSVTLKTKRMSFLVQCKSRRKPHFPHFLPALKLVAWVTILLSDTSVAFAQNWDAVFPLQSAGREDVQVFEVLAPDRIFLAGTYEMAFSPGGEDLPAFGDRDLFYGEWDDQGTNLWIEGAGGPDDDSFTAFHRAADGSLLLAGLFFDSLEIGGQTLLPDNSLGTLFLVKLTATGELLWSTIISGANAPRSIHAITQDAAANIYVAGGYGSELSFADGTLLQSQGVEDIFLAQFDQDGNLQEVSSFGQAGSSFAQRFAWLDDGRLVMAGNFNESLLLGSHQLIAESLDPDLFIVALDPASLEVEWAIRLGAQYEDQLAQLLIQNGQILVGGHFLGVLRFEPDVVPEVTTPGFNFNLFVATISAEGVPLSLAGYGGAEDQFLADLALDGDRLLFAGFYIEQLNLDGLTFPSIPNNILGFAAGRRNNWSWGTAIPGADNTLIEHIDSDEEGNVWVAGNYQTTAEFDGTTETAEGFSEGFFARLDRMLTPVQDITDAAVRIFPNPVQSNLWVQGICPQATFRISDNLGRSYPVRQNGNQLDVSHLPPGLYNLEIQSCSQKRLQRFIKH
jgi:hypothetical protein